MNSQKIGDLIFFGIFSLAGFLLFLGDVPLLEGIEGVLAEQAREMAVTNWYLGVTLNFEAQPMAPPLMVWLQAISIKIFGVSAWSVRLPGALMTMLSGLLLYEYADRHRGRLYARLVSILFLASLLTLFDGRLATMAPGLSIFLMLALFQMEQIDTQSPSGDTNAPWGIGFWLALATLTAGISVFFVAMVIFLAYKMWHPGLRFSLKALAKGLVAWLIPVGIWYGMQLMLHGIPMCMDAFLDRGQALLDKSPSHFVWPFVWAILLGIPALGWIFRAGSTDPKGHKLLGLNLPWLLVMLGWVILTASASSLAGSMLLVIMPPMALMGALYLEQVIKAQKRAGVEVYVMTIIGLLVWGLLPAFVNFLIGNLNLIGAEVESEFWLARLKLQMDWSGFEWLVGAIFLLGLAYNIINLVRRNYISYAYLQLVLGVLFVILSWRMLLPEAIRYAQGTTTEFCEKLAGQEVYILTEGPDLYTALFYAEVGPYKQAYDRARLLDDEIDRDVYLIVRGDMMDRSRRARYRLFTKLHEEGGLVFYRRAKRGRPVAGLKN